jgi:hypothetical protein
MHAKKVIIEKLFSDKKYKPLKSTFFANNFFRCILSLRLVKFFLNNRKNTDRWIPKLAYFEKKKISDLTVDFESLTFSEPKNPFSQETAENMGKICLHFPNLYEVGIIEIQKKVKNRWSFYGG